MAPYDPDLRNLIDNLGNISHVYLTQHLLKIPSDTPLEKVIPQAIEALTKRKNVRKDDWYTFEALEYGIASLPKDHPQKQEWSAQASALRKTWNVPTKRA